MKVCFIQKQMFPYLGITGLSGILRQHGHETDVLINACESDIPALVEEMNPDMIGFSLMSTEHRWLKGIIPKIKARMPHIPIIVGGVHVTLYPEAVLDLKSVDYICWGEGEIAFPLLLERLEKDERSAEGIQGIGYKEGEAHILQGVAPLLEDLDVCREDREVYYHRYSQLRNLPQKQFFSSRGCPFDCSFCVNRYIKEIFKGAGTYIRKKSPKFFIEEIKHVIDTYGATSIFFCDDLFIANVRWLEEFAELYRSKINVPFMSTGHAKIIKEGHARILANAGCHTVSFGVETGNEMLRRTVLNKNITNEDLLHCSSVLKRAGIEVQTSNMFCLPDETVEDAVSTIDLNIKMGTDYMFTTIFLPFPKTRLAEYCSEKKLLKKDYSFEDMPESFVRKSVLSKKDKNILENIHKVAHLCLLFPRLKPVFIFLAKKVRYEKLFSLFYLTGTFLRYKAERKLTYWQTIKFLWSLRKGYDNYE